MYNASLDQLVGLPERTWTDCARATFLFVLPPLQLAQYLQVSTYNARAALSSLELPGVYIETRYSLLGRLKELGSLASHARKATLLTIRTSMALMQHLEVSPEVIESIRRLKHSNPPAIRHRPGAAPPVPSPPTFDDEAVAPPMGQANAR